MFRREHGLAALTWIAAVSAVSTSGCSDDDPKPARVIFESTISPGSNPPAECPESGVWFSIGTFGAPPAVPAKPIEDGAPEQQGTAAVTCQVSPAGDGFTVRATAKLTGATGGSFTLNGSNVKEQGEQTNISAIFSKVGRTGAYNASNCVVKYETASQGIAAGRVWGNLTCAQAVASQEQRTCQAVAQFRFENCAQ